MNTKPKRPWRMFVPLAAVIGLFVLWSVYWYAANGAVQTQANSQRAQLEAQGINFVCAGEDWGGYPFRFEFTCTNPVFSFPGGHTVRSGALLAVAQAYNPTHVIVLLDGPSEVTLPNNVQRTLAHGQAIISAAARGKGDVQISAEIQDFNGAGIFTADSIQVHTRIAADNANDIAVTMESAIYNTPDKPPLAIDRAQLLATLTTSHDLDIDDLQFNQNGLKLRGKGTLSLDAENRISGRIAAETNDLGRLLAVLDPHIELAEQDRLTLRAVLGLLGKEAKADLSAQNGEFYVGPLKVGELTPLY